MIEQIKTYFPQAIENNCLWISKKQKIFIFDPNESKIIEVSTEEAANFTIVNTKESEVNILAIDKCIFNDQSDHKKCDFAAFNDKIFIFVEIKDTHKRRSVKKKNAKDQLEDTIKEFQSSINFSNYEVFVVISWRYKPTRPAISTGMQQAAFHFRKTYNAKLTEGNKFTLS